MTAERGAMTQYWLQWTLEDVLRRVLVASLVAFILASITHFQFLPPEVGNTTESDEGTGLRQAFYSLIFLTVMLSARVGSRRVAVWPIPPGLTMLLIWCLVSVSWSLAPDSTIRRLILTVIVIWTIFEIVEALGYRTTVRTLCWLLLGLLIVNYIAVFTTPLGIHQANADGEITLAGSWRGVLPHKNATGVACVMTLFVFLFEGHRFQWLIRWGVVFASAYFLYRTQSKSSLGFALFAIGCSVAFLFYNPRYRAILIPAVVILAATSIVLLNIYWADYYARLEADPTAFTGRITIWQVLISYIQDHMLLGAGYGAFWNTGDASPAVALSQGWLKNVIVGHSGYLDVASQIGIPGMIVTVAVMLLIPIGRILAYTHMPKRAGAFLLATLIFCMTHNLTETSLLERDMILEVMLLITIASVYTIIRERQKELAVPRLTYIDHRARRLTTA